MIYANNPAYQLAAQQDEYRIYTPVNAAEGYHTCRFVEASNQNIYSSSGATKDVLNQVMDEMISRCNNPAGVDTLRTDIAALANSIKYRLSYPVDQLCSLRMGAILSFMEYERDGTLFSEAPDKCEDWWIKKKMNLALDYPDLYTFFLSWGVRNTPAYTNLLDTLSDSDYFEMRKGNLLSLRPQATG